MSSFIVKVLPIILIFLTGWFTRMIGLFKIKDGDFLLKLVLNITLPALIVGTAQDIVFKKEYIFLPLIAVSVVLLTAVIAHIIGRQLKLSTPALGSFLCGSMIMNTGFCLPFFQAVMGNEGVVLANLFDLGNTFMIYTFIYMHAVKFGKVGNGKTDWTKLLKLPPLWGLIIGFGLSFIGVVIPDFIQKYLLLIGSPTTPLIMLSLGIYFHPHLARIPKALIAVLIRMGLGLAFGFTAVSLLNIQGIARQIVIISCGAPIGFNTIVFANLESLDKEFAATMVSIALFLGLALVPLFLYIF